LLVHRTPQRPFSLDHGKVMGISHDKPSKATLVPSLCVHLCITCFPGDEYTWQCCLQRLVTLHSPPTELLIEHQLRACLLRKGSVGQSPECNHNGVGW
jgi:hypothetical protein